MLCQLSSSFPRGAKRGAAHNSCELQSTAPTHPTRRSVAASCASTSTNTQVLHLLGMWPHALTKKPWIGKRTCNQGRAKDQEASSQNANTCTTHTILDTARRKAVRRANLNKSAHTDGGNENTNEKMAKHKRKAPERETAAQASAMNRRPAETPTDQAPA